MVYLITFAYYGCRLHGSAEGSVDRHHNAFGTPVLETDQNRINMVESQMAAKPYTLKEPHWREAVLASIKQVCEFKQTWALLAAHVRTTHVHLVVGLPEPTRVEKALEVFKAYASRALTHLDGITTTNQRRWARHGSTRWLWTKESILSAMAYVVEGQGHPMAVYRTDQRI
jgi:REP element-mobilizing transposase RayT